MLKNAIELSTQKSRNKFFLKQYIFFYKDLHSFHDMLLYMLSVYNLCIFAHAKVIKTYRQNRKFSSMTPLPP